MPSKYVAKSYVDSSVAKLSNEMTAEMEKTIGETKEGLQTIVRPIIDRLGQLSLTECTTTAAVVEVSNDVAKIKKRILGTDKKLGMLVEGGCRKHAEGMKGSEWVKGRTVRSAVDIIDMVTELTGETDTWNTRVVQYIITELRNEVWAYQTERCAKKLTILSGCHSPGSEAPRGAH